MNIDWLKQRSELSPDREAVKDVFRNKSWTYKQLNERAENLAGYFLSKGVQKGSRVCLISQNDISHLDFLFACAKIGAIFVPINYRLNLNEIDNIVEDCKPSVIGLTSSALELVSEKLQSCHTIFIDSEEYEYNVNHSNGITVSFLPSERMDEAVIIYTSGSTGVPKGVVITHDTLIGNCLNTLVSWNLDQSDCTIVVTPMCHTSGLFSLAAPLLMVGGKVVIQKKFNADETIRFIKKEKCTIVFMVPTMYYLMTQSSQFTKENLSSVKAFISGGAPCQEQIFSAFEREGLPFKESYGLTEAGPNNFYLDPLEAKRRKGSVGKPIMFVNAQIVNENGKQVKTGEVGELVLSGNHLFKCYWNKEKETKQSLKNGKLFTGDLARKDEDGYYYITGRKKDIIISGGENIYPLEIENVLNAFPGVDSSVVLGLPDKKWGEKVVAMVSSQYPERLTEEDLQQFCRQRLGSYKVPREILIVDKLPLNGVGKIDKGKVREYFTLQKASVKSL